MEKVIIEPDGSLLCPGCKVELGATASVTSIAVENLRYADGKLLVDVFIPASANVSVGLLYCMHCDFHITNIEFHKQRKETDEFTFVR